MRIPGHKATLLSQWDLLGPSSPWLWDLRAWLLSLQSVHAHPVSSRSAQEVRKNCGLSHVPSSQMCTAAG